jgi:hypothetical protein
MAADLVLRGQCIAAGSRHDLGAKGNSLLLPLRSVTSTQPSGSSWQAVQIRLVNWRRPIVQITASDPAAALWNDRFLNRTAFFAVYMPSTSQVGVKMALQSSGARRLPREDQPPHMPSPSGGNLDSHRLSQHLGAFQPRRTLLIHRKVHLPRTLKFVL